MKRVLIVEDDRQAAAQLAARLCALGFETRTADTADRAVEVLRQHNVAVLLADLEGTGCRGLELMELARRVSPRTRALLMGAGPSAQDYKAALERGAVDVLTKPVTVPDLFNAVRKAAECGDGFTASIHGLPLLDLLQVLHRGQRSLVVRIGPSGAAIFVYNGEIVHAVRGQQTGREALLALLSTPFGTLSTTPFEGCVQTISQPFEPLLAELLRELADRNAPPPPPLVTGSRRQLLPVFLGAMIGGVVTATLVLGLLLWNHTRRPQARGVAPVPVAAVQPPPTPRSVPLPPQPGAAPFADLPKVPLVALPSRPRPRPARSRAAASQPAARPAPRLSAPRSKPDAGSATMHAQRQPAVGTLGGRRPSIGILE
jgi:CheY-like chemotaxis protein